MATETVKKRNKKTYVLFWLNSSRGSVDKTVRGFTGWPVTPAWIEKELLRWCKSHSCWDHGENSISYGYKTVKMLPRRELLKRYNIASKRKQKADDQWRTLAAMLNPMIVSN